MGNGGLITFNKKYLQLWPKAKEIKERGGTFEDLIRSHVAEGKIVDAQGREEEFIQERLEQHRKLEGSIIRQFSDGTWYMIEEVRTPEDGIAVSFIDITELKQAEEALRDSEEKHRRFSTNVAHELRTPLALLRAQFDSLENTELIQSLKKDVDAMARLVSQIMATTQLDSFAGNPNDEANLRAVGFEVVKRLAPFAIKEDRSIELTGTQHPVIVQGNGDALEMAVRNLAVRNLVENAIQYSARETMISVHVSDEPAISVTNIGQGIPPQKRNAIFQRFTRTDRRSGGVGLGLSIVKRVVETHQATIDVSDAPGGGAVFKISFPSHKNLKVVES